MAKSTAKNMAKSTTKTKKRVTSSVQPQALSQVSLTLTDLPEKPKASWSLREAIEELQESITIAMQRGYRYEEIVDVLASCGIHITASSLKRYLSIAKRTNSTAKPRRTSRAQAARTQAASSANGSANGLANGSQKPEAPAPEADLLLEIAPRRRGRSASATKTAAKAKAAPRTTASRKRSQ